MGKGLRLQPAQQACENNYQLMVAVQILFEEASQTNKLISYGYKLVEKASY